ncbi:hypothetical protein EDF66_11614 [Sphingobacterium sp. JUb20]|nr:hypothetical protein [Sphingobacterium sp. JUb21]TCQ98904.1 hypothetical protein EDF66_11614 [Sphingobacterium sp. JUb20]
MALDSKNKQPACGAVVTKHFYDKRLIKKIVKEVEEDLPHFRSISNLWYEFINAPSVDA